MKRLLVVLTVLVIPHFAFAETIELSFGSTLLYSSQILTRNGQTEERQLPTPSLLFLGEWFPADRWSVAGLVNVPLEPVRRIENGEIVENYVAVSLAVGGAWAPIRTTVLEDDLLTIQAGLFVGRTLGATVGDVFFPLLVTRLHLTTNSGFTMYMGAAFAGRRDTLALVYGVGQRF